MFPVFRRFSGSSQQLKQPTDPGSGKVAQFHALHDIGKRQVPRWRTKSMTATSPRMTKTTAGKQMSRLTHGTTGKRSVLLQRIVPPTAARDRQPLTHRWRHEVAHQILVKLSQASGTGHTSLGRAGALPCPGGTHLTGRPEPLNTVKCAIYGRPGVKISAVEGILRHISGEDARSLQRCNTVKFALRQADEKIQIQRAADALLPERPDPHTSELQHQNIHQRPESLGMVAMLRGQPGRNTTFYSRTAGIQVSQRGSFCQRCQPALMRKKFGHCAAGRRESRPEFAYLQLRSATAIMQGQQETQRRCRLGGRKNRNQGIPGPAVACTYGQHFLPMTPDRYRRTTCERFVEPARQFTNPISLHTE